MLGPDFAERIMSSLPAQPVSQLATQSDIHGVKSQIDRLETRLDRLEIRMDKVETEMRAGFNDIHIALREQQRTYTMLTIGSLTALAAIFSVIVGLIT